MTIKSEANSSKNVILRNNKIEFRKYQKVIADKCINRNSLVVLPTGLGKTIIAILVSAGTLEFYPNDSKIIVLAPTRPLINQHYESFAKFLNISEDNFYVLTGKSLAKNRANFYKENRILFYTPQTLRNDLVNGKYTLDKTCLIIFDEAHHAIGDYPYTLIADMYVEQNPDGVILGLTASPGASKKKIDLLCKSIHVPLENTHFRTRKDKDVKIYLKPLDLYKIGVNLTGLMEDVYDAIRFLIEERLKYLTQLGFLDIKGDVLFKKIIRKDLLKLNKELIGIINSSGDKTGAYSALSINAQALKLYHMIELIEQQGLDNLLEYLEKLYKDAVKPRSSKADKILSSELRLHNVFLKLKENEDYSPERLIHPKYYVLKKILFDEINHNTDSRILVFVKFRVSVKNIVNKLKRIEKIRPARFVGQATKSKDDKGLSQKRQIEILEQFKEGRYNVLVSTNVGEEGLDIAECDLVIFYDVVASETRFIQRRGRTARHREGKVVILYCKNTNDDIYMRIVLSKLKKMNVNLKRSNELKNYYNSRTEEIENEEEKQETIPTTEKKPFLEDERTYQPLKKKRQSNLELFMKSKTDNINSKKTSHKFKIKICKSFPMKLGLRKELTNAGILFKIVNSNIHIVVHNKILLQIYEPNNYSEELKKQILIFNNKMKSRYQLVVNIIDFIGFEESYEGEMHLLKRELREYGTKYNIKIIPMDNTKDLFIIVRDLYQHSQIDRGV